nr:MAG TPA: hypothetical protein [Inoviridae sp.]
MISLDRVFYLISAILGLVLSLIFLFCTLTGLWSGVEIFDTAYDIFACLGCVYIAYESDVNLYE